MSYCDFQVGDQVVCVDASPRETGLPFYGMLVEGQTYIVKGFTTPPVGHRNYGRVTVVVEGAPNICRAYQVEIGYFPSRFRKVQRRNTDLSIEAFLTIKPGFEEPKRAPAPKRERVS